MTYNKGTWGTYVWDPNKTREENLLAAEKFDAAVTQAKMENIEQGILDVHEKTNVLEEGEGARKSSESERRQNEEERKVNEDGRFANEEFRRVDEENRKLSELARESAESERMSNEEERISKDSERDSKIEAVEGLQADLISGAVDSAAVQQHVEERYGQLEEEYAPKLTEVTAQLAQKANEEYVQSRLYDKRDKSVAIGLNDASPELLAAIEGGEGTSFNLLSIPQYKSVTPQKTTFIKPSTNLFNINDVTVGKVISVTGEIVDNSNYVYSHPVEVTPGATLTTFGVYFIAFYDINDTFISRIGQGTTDVFTFTVPENSYIVRLNVGTTSDAYASQTIQVNNGNELLPFEPYYLEMDRNISVYRPPLTNADLPQIEPNKFNFMVASTNLFNIDDITLGKVIDASGVIVDNEKYAYSHPIEVTPNYPISISGVYYVAFYDEQNNFLVRLGSFDGVATTIDVPSNARTARLDFMTTGDAYAQRTIQVNRGDALLPFEEFGYKLNKQYLPDIISGGSNYIMDTSLEGVFNTDTQFDDFTNNGWATNNSGDVYAMVDTIQSSYPEYITKQPLTPDLTGLEIAAYHLNPKRPQMTIKKPYPTIFIVTGTHGYERSSVINMYHLVKELCESWKENELIEALRFNVNIIWIPVVNPYGWSVGGGAKYQRYNSNGIDIARQFPDDWVKRDPDDNTYGGEEPLTEVEALNVKQIFDENPDINIFYDYHNFGDAVDEYIWLATASAHSEQLGEALIKKMSRKWSSEFTFIPEEKLVGYTSIMNQGTMHNYAYKSLGIKRSGTFETNNQFHLDSNGVKYNQDSVKAGLEAIVNFLLINLRDLVE